MKTLPKVFHVECSTEELRDLQGLPKLNTLGKWLSGHTFCDLKTQQSVGCLCFDGRSWHTVGCPSKVRQFDPGTQLITLAELTAWATETQEDTNMQGTPALQAGFNLGTTGIVTGNTNAHYFEIGQRVHLTGDDGSTSPLFRGADGSEWYVKLDEIELLHPKALSGTPAEQAGITVGTKVRITGNGNPVIHTFKHGEVVELCWDDGTVSPVFEDSTGFKQYVSLQNVELHETEKQAEEFVVGDYVVCIDPRKDCYGLVCIVTDEADCVGDYRIEALDKSDFDYVRALGLRRADPSGIPAPECTKTPLELADFAVGDSVQLTVPYKGAPAGTVFVIVEDDGTYRPHCASETSPLRFPPVSSFEKVAERTPAEREGWTVGDLGLVVEVDGAFEEGTVVRFHRDDGSICPSFEALDASDYNYLVLGDDVVRLVRADSLDATAK